MNTVDSANKQSSVDALLGQRMSISHHAFFDREPSAYTIGIYFEAFAIVCAGGDALSVTQSSYLAALCRHAGYEDAPEPERILQLAQAPQDIALDAVLALLQDPVVRACWFIDAVFLGCDEQGLCAGVEKSLLQLAHTLGIKTVNAKRVLDHAVTLATSDNEDELIDAIGFFNRHCKGRVWQAIVDFRRISFSQGILKIQKALFKDFTTGMVISMEISKLDMGSLLNCMEIGGESWLMQKGLLLLRKMTIGDFNKLKARASEYASSHEEMFDAANRVIAAFGCSRVSNPLSLRHINADDNSSLANEDWYDNMSKALDQLRDFLEAEGDAVNQVLDRLALVAEGNWEGLSEKEVSQEEAGQEAASQEDATQEDATQEEITA